MKIFLFIFFIIMSLFITYLVSILNYSYNKIIENNEEIYKSYYEFIYKETGINLEDELNNFYLSNDSNEIITTVIILIIFINMIAVIYFVKKDLIKEFNFNNIINVLTTIISPILINQIYKNYLINNNIIANNFSSFDMSNTIFWLISLLSLNIVYIVLFFYKKMNSLFIPIIFMIFLCYLVIGIQFHFIINFIMVFFFLIVIFLFLKDSSKEKMNEYLEKINNLKEINNKFRNRIFTFLMLSLMYIFIINNEYIIYISLYHKNNELCYNINNEQFILTKLENSYNKIVIHSDYITDENIQKYYNKKYHINDKSPNWFYYPCE